MNDIKLIELAAKAAGIWSEEDPWKGMLKDTGQDWNPLTDDGDALRLAVGLGISVWRDKDVICCNGGGFGFYNDDPYAATRRAIVRAAAEIGKAMP